jgi:uncharacterized damage-inducible protein DinB
MANQKLFDREISKTANMKKILSLLTICLTMLAKGQDAAPTLKSVLLEQLKTTHNKQDWFVPVNQSLAGLTADQAMWKEGTANHSVGQIANHLLFWNKQQLDKFKGKNAEPFDGNNDETFNKFDKNSWTKVVEQLDAVLTEWEKAIEQADETKLKVWYGTIGHISTHNAYHTGQILYIRKQQGSWDSSKGVK